MIEQAVFTLGCRNAQVLTPKSCVCVYAGPECTKPAHTSKATAQRDASEEPVERPEGAEEVEGMSSPEEVGI